MKPDGLWLASQLVEALESLPNRSFEGAARYDTDDEYVLHLWAEGQSWDLRVPKVEGEKLPESIW